MAAAEAEQEEDDGMTRCTNVTHSSTHSSAHTQTHTHTQLQDTQQRTHREKWIQAVCQTSISQLKQRQMEANKQS